MRKIKLISAIIMMILLLGGVVFSVVYLTKKDREAKVITTIFPVYDICREIMGDDDELMLLEDNGSDMHSFTPTASDIAAISNAELFIYVGGESDEWVSDVMRSVSSVNLITMPLMEIENLNRLEENNENILDNGHDHEHEHNHEDGEVVYDEHIWLSIRNVIVIVEEIRINLTKVFPEKQELFKENAEKYLEKLEILDEEYTETFATGDNTIIVADRFPFRYLVKDYNLDYYAIFTGCSAETEASTETIAKLIDKINEEDVDYILILESSDKSIALSCTSNSNCKKGVEILVINSCQSISQSTMQSMSYLQIMTKNLEILKKATGR